MQWFLVVSWILVKLKSNLKNRWVNHLSNKLIKLIQVKLKKLQLDFVHAFLYWFLVVYRILVRLKLNLNNLSLSLFMCSCIFLVFVERWILVKLKLSSTKWVWLCTCAYTITYNWGLTVRQTQVKLEWVEFVFVHVLLHWFLVEKWIVRWTQIKLKKWVCLRTCACAITFNLILNARQTEVKLE